MDTNYLALIAFLIGCIFEFYTIVLYVVNFLKRKRYSGLELISGAFFLYSLVYLFIHSEVSIFVFLILLILLISTRYLYSIILQWFEKQVHEDKHNLKKY